MNTQISQIYKMQEQKVFKKLTYLKKLMFYVTDDSFLYRYMSKNLCTRR